LTLFTTPNGWTGAGLTTCDLPVTHLTADYRTVPELPGLYTAQMHCALTLEPSPETEHTKQDQANVSYSG
jgi:hypothetical protein